MTKWQWSLNDSLSLELIPVFFFLFISHESFVEYTYEKKNELDLEKVIDTIKCVVMYVCTER